MSDTSFLNDELSSVNNIDFANIDFTALGNPQCLAQPTTPPIKQATFKACPQHFKVDEQLDVTFTQEGEHLWLLVKKTGMNTAHLATLLAQWANIPQKDMGYSGLKDRQAVTTQWFSLRLPNRQLPTHAFVAKGLNDGEEVEIIQKQWHNKKLGRGTHYANKFTILLTHIRCDEPNWQPLIEAHLQYMAQNGVPNYFGAQRFGHDGNNIKAALAWFNSSAFKQAYITQSTDNDSNSDTKSPHIKGSHTKISHKKRHKRLSKRQREQQSIWLSAARSLLFNHILHNRVINQTWDTGINGEVFNLAGTNSVFATTQLDDALCQRLQKKDIHPTAVLWGIDNDKVAGIAKQTEQDVVNQHALFLSLAQGLEAYGVKAHRRALRLMPADLTWRWPPCSVKKDADGGYQENTANDNFLPDLQLQFTLPTGSYATCVLYGLVKHLVQE